MKSAIGTEYRPPYLAAPLLLFAVHITLVQMAFRDDNSDNIWSYLMFTPAAVFPVWIAVRDAALPWADSARLNRALATDLRIYTAFLKAAVFYLASYIAFVFMHIFSSIRGAISPEDDHGLHYLYDEAVTSAEAFLPILMITGTATAVAVAFSIFILQPILTGIFPDDGLIPSPRQHQETSIAHNVGSTGPEADPVAVAPTRSHEQGSIRQPDLATESEHETARAPEPQPAHPGNLRPTFTFARDVERSTPKSRSQELGFTTPTAPNNVQAPVDDDWDYEVTPFRLRSSGKKKRRG